MSERSTRRVDDDEYVDMDKLMEARTNAKNKLIREIFA